jgi:hypothetical protein
MIREWTPFTRALSLLSLFSLSLSLSLSLSRDFIVEHAYDVGFKPSRAHTVLSLTSISFTFA